jgi:UDP-N-acetylmuramoylalanine--D-glutamate ligase
MLSATVIGLGRSGIAAAKILQRQGYQVTISDRATRDNVGDRLAALEQQANSLGITVKLGDTFAPTTDLDKLVVSPGVPWDNPALVQAREMGIETIGEMELAWQEMKSLPWVGITGTNGKTTVTALTGAIFQAGGLNAPACGNIGYAASEIALREPQPDWVIGEISSYQVESSPTLAPRIGIFTTLTPDHLSRHQTVENYYAIKASLIRQSTFQVLNGDDPYLVSVAEQWPHAIWTSIGGFDKLPGNPEKGTWIADGWVYCQGQQILPIADLQMPGIHNQQNLLMAVTAARLAGIAPAAIQSAVAAFLGVTHRLEYICTWQGVKYINDSKATNYDAADVGLGSVEAPTILIAGGEPKEGDDRPWLQTIKAKAAAVLLIGEAAPQFAKRLQEVGFDRYEIVETMARAVPRSAELAAAHQAKVVLLSPACASFDQYQSFEARGEDFRKLCQQNFVGDSKIAQIADC